MAVRSSTNFNIDLPLFPIQVSQLNNQPVKHVEFDKTQSNAIRTISIVNKIIQVKWRYHKQSNILNYFWLLIVNIISNQKYIFYVAWSLTSAFNWYWKSRQGECSHLPTAARRKNFFHNILAAAQKRVSVAQTESKTFICRGVLYLVF